MLDNGDVLLHEILIEELDRNEREDVTGVFRASNPPPAEPEENKKDTETHTQWALGGNGKFTPVGTTTPRLQAGVYEPFAVPGIWGLEQISVTSDGIYTLPDMATETVLTEIRKFWDSAEKYKQHNLLYKRGVILWGPCGSGKSITIKLLMQELIKRDGLVIMGQNVGITMLCLKAIRRIEHDRNLVVVLEDIDDIIQYNGEAALLSMLDGEHHISNVLHVASTNYPERLGARIINRPSRFDRRIYVGMPSKEARIVYLQKATNYGLTDRHLSVWAKDTEGLSIAHLRELVAAVYCLEQPYADVLERLKAMTIPVKSEDGFKQKNMGFVGNARAAIGPSAGPFGN